MDVFINELSLHGQFESADAFLNSLKEVVNCRRLAETNTHSIYCLRGISQRLTVGSLTFQQAIQRSGDRNLIRIITSWLDKHGPFWDDTRMHSSNEWFEYDGNVVTDHTLGEVAYRVLQNQDATTLSFQPSKFMYSPVTIIWRHGEENKEADVVNFWTATTLEQFCLNYRSPITSWNELIIRLRADCTQLTFLDSVSSGLSGEPFNLTIARQVEELLVILDRIKACFDDTGSMTENGFQLLQNFFHGDRAKFTDESESNKHRFHQEMTFRKPDGEMIFCPYHGKISHRYFRIHFTWPIRHNEPLFIGYIGPKLTKH